MNNAIARYDSTAATRTFFELVRHRCLEEMAHPEKYTGWDQSAIARVLYEGNVTFDRRGPDLRVVGGRERMVLSSRNPLNISVVAFQPTAARREHYWLQVRDQGGFRTIKSQTGGAAPPSES